MTRERKILLVILGLMILGFLGQLYYRSMGGRRQVLEDQVVLTEQRIESLERRLEAEDLSETNSIAEEELYWSRLAALSETQELYPFGQGISRRLGYRGLSIQRYQEIRQGEIQLLEYHLEGRVLSMMIFLRDVYREEPLVEIPLLTIDTRQDPARFQLRIAPAGLQDLQELEEQLLLALQDDMENIPQETEAHRRELQVSAYGLAALFPWPQTQEVVEVPAEEDPPPPLPQVPTIDRTSLSFVGSITTGEGQTRLCFKNSRSGAMVLLSPDGEMNPQGWQLESYDGMIYRIIQNQEIYEVQP